MRRRHFAALLSLALATAAVGASVAPTLARAPRGETAAERNARIDKVWTAAQMRAAIPRDFVRQADGRFVPKARPGGGGGGAVTGASWTRGGDVTQRTGKVFFRMGGSGYVCSGSVAADTNSGFSLVLTAGHCAFDESAGVFATDWTFVPNYDASPTFTCTQALHGCWDADALVVHNGYAEAGGFNDQAVLYDFAFAVVRAGEPTSAGQLDAKVGSYPLAVNGLALNERVASFGYPAAGKYKGNDLTYCAGPVIEDVYNDDKTWGVGCGMTGGSSGGPWFEGLNETTGGGGVLSSLNSYGYSGIRNMYGPKFNADTTTVYDAARQGPTNDTRVGVAP